MVIAHLKSISTFKSLYSSQTRGRTQADTRSVLSEQVPKASLILSPLEKDPERYSSSKFLGDKNVDLYNASPLSSLQGFSGFLSVRVGLRGLPLQDAAVWAVHSPGRLHRNDGFLRETGKRVEFECPGFSGWHNPACLS